MSKKQNDNETKLSVNDLNARFIQNEKRNPSLYTDVPYVNEKDIIPKVDTEKSGYGFRLLKESELTKAQLKNSSLMKDHKADTHLNRARNAMINSINNLQKVDAILALAKS
tara:strand:+ start:110 stop:442 length:333 start_codon:yes stop_codon:yes gene_type:complete